MNLQSVFQSFSDTSPSLWDVEFAKQLATVSEQPLQNGFEELIQWTKGTKRGNSGSSQLTMKQRLLVSRLECAIML
ncbi:PREDICTED: 28S ribosomal protein S31, mitochondrial-like [Rhinopithecus bieti]|uniref:28S ribosomal protein S31, mitochondrial-like n=1 Tax=Rhinopithecus bieti TaxID=61621 RepID=UPI00083C8C2E|nr:PREDICTED: 28S ribosomal protein S31, mitochondrial-like [Rhinopithecus bieti]